ncbi:MAG: hypothetical protein H6983_06760 [Ectothiorhodospiraceae bacterium]|nr:hypothetical protein [Chromatiales bacterium]MCP5153847.1 hypothetical protein [Ectothiorhodospiraceae bacterium]
MHPLVEPFLRISLLRMRPQDLPASGLLLAIALLAHTVTGIAVSMMSLPLGQSIAAALTDTALLVVLTATLLLAHGHRARMAQTLTALAGAGAVVGLVALPVTAWLHATTPVGGPPGAAAVALLALIGWSIAVVGHVLRHALSAPLFVGLAVAVIFYWISLSVLNHLFPVGS